MSQDAMSQNVMSVSELLTHLQLGPVSFSEVMAVVDTHYRFSPTAFRNGQARNAADTNNGSCKIFAFGKLHGLSEQATLNAFGDFYTKDVLGNPDGGDHANIRNFMQTGWDGIAFDGEALQDLGPA
ncbi:MAG: hypothetical protein ACI89D_002226 [Bermanella sp.]|jgi:hypothetical protein